MEAIVHSGIFDGERGHMIFSHALPLLTQGKYKFCGQLLEWSLSQGGAGIPVWSHNYYNLLVGCPSELTADVDYLSDAAVAEKIKKVRFL